MLIGSFGRFYWSAPLVGFIGRLDLSLVLLGHARQPGRPNTVVNRDREHEKKKKKKISVGRTHNRKPLSLRRRLGKVCLEPHRDSRSRPGDDS